MWLACFGSADGTHLAHANSVAPAGAAKRQIADSILGIGGGLDGEGSRAQVVEEAANGQLVEDGFHAPGSSEPKAHDPSARTPLQDCDATEKTDFWGFVGQ